MGTSGGAHRGRRTSSRDDCVNTAASSPSPEGLGEVGGRSPKNTDVCRAVRRFPFPARASPFPSGQRCVLESSGTWCPLWGCCFPFFKPPPASRLCLARSGVPQKYRVARGHARTSAAPDWHLGAQTRTVHLTEATPSHQAEPSSFWLVLPFLIQSLRPETQPKHRQVRFCSMLCLVHGLTPRRSRLRAFQDRPLLALPAPRVARNDHSTAQASE